MHRQQRLFSLSLSFFSRLFLAPNRAILFGLARLRSSKHREERQLFHFGARSYGFKCKFFGPAGRRRALTASRGFGLGELVRSD